MLKYLFRGIIMAHTNAHNFTYSFGWNRFYGFGFFGVETQRA